MNIQRRLDNLRAKPEHVRRMFAFWSSFGFSAVVLAFWLASYTTLGSGTQGAVARAVGSVGSPSQSLVASVGGLFSDIRDLVFGPKKVSYSAIQVSPGK